MITRIVSLAFAHTACKCSLTFELPRKEFLTLTLCIISRFGNVGGIHDAQENPNSPEIAHHCGFMKNEAAEVLEALLYIIKKGLIAGEDIMISGFRKWHVRSKRLRRGRNPKTGHEIVLDARRVVNWRYSPILKKALNGGGKGSRE